MFQYYQQITIIDSKLIDTVSNKKLLDIWWYSLKTRDVTT